ncbi:Eukaryotic translation initiation factor 4B (plasmid) [Rhodovastum atsumiense]|uniref:Uncharacterized protein n=1 Tax=Rhodovastum atsumiense TaxID=504468 RepID=A0A5M6ITJ4_9PROT|nr:hypothetical protein [Rhodovastum atsumiense]KAA5611582.1 hypothetical protein F1189_13540 [Rhodovastum atsumiense]CAH2606335.1 Eukaryotic translation initiation factor 4B [Rhodovastum atsumiense]
MAKNPTPAAAAAEETAAASDAPAPKAKPTTAGPAPAPVADEAPLVSLEEAAAAISQGIRSATLVSAFHAEEKAAGRLRDTEAAYRARFVGFRRRPTA